MGDWIGMWLQWDDADRVQLKYREENLSQYQFFYHKSHMDWAATKIVPPWWEARTFWTRVRASDMLLFRWSDFVRSLRCFWKSDHITAEFWWSKGLLQRAYDNQNRSAEETMLRVKDKVVYIHAMKTRGRWGVAPLMPNLGSRWNRVFSFTLRPLGTLDTLDLVSDTF